MAAVRPSYKDRNILTAAEEALLDALSPGRSILLAADKLGISKKTATGRLATILEKLCVDTTAQAIEKWRKERAA